MRYISLRKLLLASALAVFPAFSQLPTDGEQEEFLRKAKVVVAKGTKVGITNSMKVSLESGTMKHDGHWQPIDEFKQSFQTANGTELNFRDSWKYNVAAYKLDRLLQLNMTPVHVERKYRGTSGSMGWWADNVLMMEGERFQKKMEPPDQESWNNQMHIVRMFDQLIYNTDRNLQNLLITKDWQIIMIDHSRAFRLFHDLREAKNLAKIERGVLERLRKITEEEVRKAVGRHLTGPEVVGLMKRRDKIVAIFDEKIRKEGEAAVLYDLAKK